MNKKTIWKSKTFWMGLLTALVPLVSNHASEAIAEHTGTFTMLWGALAIVLRMVTKDKVILVE